MNTDILAWGGIPGGWEFVVIFFMCIPMYILPAVAFWRICSRLGFPGALGLLMFVPVANIILLFFIAFAEWPVLRDRGQSAQ